MSFPQRGGVQKGSGRKSTNQTLGTPQRRDVRQSGLHSFFQSSSKNTTATTPQSSSTNTRTTPIRNLTVQDTNVNTEAFEAFQSTHNNVPNLDIEEIVDENLYLRGKKRRRHLNVCRFSAMLS